MFALTDRARLAGSGRSPLDLAGSPRCDATLLGRPLDGGRNRSAIILGGTWFDWSSRPACL